MIESPSIGTSLAQAADVLLLAALEERATSILVEPSGSGYAVRFEAGASRATCAEVGSTVGQALVARLALMAGLDVATSEAQLGRLRVGFGGGGAEFLALVSASAAGLALELRRFDAVASTRSAPGLDGDGLPHLDGYRTLGEMGRGAMGIVYRAQHELLQRPVAIKVIHEELARDPTVAAMFVREARAASRTRHPGVVEVLDFGTLGSGRSYLVMELVESPTLDLLLQAGPLEPAVAVDLAIAIADALGCVHAEGVVHRDLKPSNVFVVSERAVKLADFGAAKIVHDDSAGSSMTQLGIIVGTPDYMSPEHCHGRSTDGRTDLYALGCVLFQMLTGHTPYAASTPLGVQLLQIQGPLPLVSSPLGKLPEILKSTVLRAMQKSAARRYQSAAEMMADLERAARKLGP